MRITGRLTQAESLSHLVDEVQKRHVASNLEEVSAVRLGGDALQLSGVDVRRNRKGIHNGSRVSQLLRLELSLQRCAREAIGEQKDVLWNYLKGEVY